MGRTYRWALGWALLTAVSVTSRPAAQLEANSIAPTVPAAAGPSGELTLGDALAAVLRGNPHLAAFSWRVRAREAETLQAGLRLNPELGLELEDFAGSDGLSGFGGSETTISLSQLLEMGGKRSKRLRVAELDHDLAAWEYEAVRTDVLAEAAKAFVQVLAAQELLALAGQLVGVADDVLESVGKLVKAGGVSPVEESRARVDLESARIDLAQARHELSIARTRLAATWGSARPDFRVASGDLEEKANIPPLAELRERIEENPEVARWRTELHRRRAELSLERANRLPDLTLGGGVRHHSESGDTGLLLGLTLPLPLFDRNQGSSAAAAFQEEGAEEERRAAMVRGEVTLSVAYERFRAAEAEVAALSDRLLSEAESAFSATRDAYAGGLMRFTDVLDARRVTFELRARRVRALARYHAAATEIARQVGSAPHGEERAEEEEKTE